MKSGACPWKLLYGPLRVSLSVSVVQLERCVTAVVGVCGCEEARESKSLTEFYCGVWWQRSLSGPLCVRVFGDSSR